VRRGGALWGVTGKCWNMQHLYVSRARHCAVCIALHAASSAWPCHPPFSGLGATPATPLGPPPAPPACPPPPAPPWPPPPPTRSYLQKRVLNASKGPAVWALRAQTDKLEYAACMRKVLEETPNLFIREGAGQLGSWAAAVVQWVAVGQWQGSHPGRAASAAGRQHGRSRLHPAACMRACSAAAGKPPVHCFAG
jgi:hypothetical protein